MKENNFCFIDGQNLNLGTPYSLDFQKFRTYLKDKYKVTKAYYFLGCVDSEHQDLYSNLQEAGYILIFREHNKNFKGLKKKGVPHVLSIAVTIFFFFASFTILERS